MATTALSLVATPASLSAVSVNPGNPYASPTALFSIISSGVPYVNPTSRYLETNTYGITGFQTASLILDSDPARSTLMPSQTMIPQVYGTDQCPPGIQYVASNKPACGTDSSENSALILLKCCNGAPRVSYNKGCNLVCDAQNQTVEQLQICIINGANNIGLGALLCNRDGQDYSSLLPVETIPASFAQNQPSSSTRATSTTKSSSAPLNVSSSPATFTGAASSIRDRTGGAIWLMSVAAGSLCAAAGFAILLL